MAHTVNPQMLLTRHNYPQWVVNITRILQLEGLIVWVDKEKWPDFKDLNSIEIFKLEQSKAKTVGLLKTYCSPDIELEIRHLNSPEVIWSTLKDNLQNQTRTFKSCCLSEFNNIRKNPEEELPTYIARFEECYRKVIESGGSITEDYRCFLLLQTLSDDYDFIAREFDDCDESECTFEKIKAKILKEYQRRTLREINKSECLETIKETQNKCTPARNTSPLCTICKKRGHIAKVCRVKENHNSTFITEFISECYESDSLPPTREWTLDSASTSHICQNKEFFTSLRPPSSGSIIKMGTTAHNVQGIGTVEFTIKDGLKVKKICLRNTLFVPTIHRNLISMSKMDNVGMHAKLDKGFKIFTPRWQYLWSAKLKNNFYVIYGVPINKELKNIKRENEGKVNDYAFTIEHGDINLWHERLAHCNFFTIKKMFREKLIEPELSLKGEEQCCEACIYGKNTRASFKRLNQIRSRDILQLVHTDVWGPAPYTAKHGYRYVLTLLDDFSRRAFCYPMRTKNEVYEKLKNFIQFIERQTGKRIRAMRSDNGMEYCCQTVKELLEKHGIKHERTNIYSPQQNGCAERLNRILFDGMRTLLNAANLPNDLWLEAMQATNYVRNRILHSSTNDIPFKRWYGRKPSLKHLKRYGCIAYVHIPSQKRNKFDPRAKRGIMVGYAYGTRGYRIYLPEDDTILETKHVTFDEEKLAIEKESCKLASEFSDDPFEDHQPTTSKTKTEQELKLGLDIPKINTEKLPLPKEVTCIRYIKERMSGESKGKIDIYVRTPENQILRSTKELKEYCDKNRLLFDDTLKIFSKDCKIKDTFVLERKVEDPELESEEVNCTEAIIPRTPREAKSLPDAQCWKEAMDAEIKTMLDRKVWSLELKPENARVIGTRWVYTLKNKDKSRRYKARLVALGNRQQEGKDFNETYSPVVNFTLIRLFIAFFVCIFQWEHSLLDVRCAYLYGDIDKDIYINQPADYIVQGKEQYVLKLHKALYGLHQSGRCWYEELHNKLINNNFSEIPGTTCVYNYKNKAIVMVYVDDLLVFAKNQTSLNEVVKILESLYEVENLGPIKRFLGINFEIEENEVKINCPEYIKNCLTKFNINDFSNVTLPLQPGTVTSKQEMPRNEEERRPMENLPYRNLIGCLLYISGRCRPDISYSVATLSQVIENPSIVHWKRLTQILKYLASTKELSLRMKSSGNFIQLSCFADASWASDPTDRKSWSGYSIFLNGIPITWRVVKQSCIALSPMEAEFIATAEAAKDLKYLTSTINTIIRAMDLHENINIHKPIIFCDNTASIQFTKNRSQNIRNRHIDLKYMYVRALYEEGHFDIKHVKSQENVSDILTKALPKESFQRLRSAYLS